MKQDGKKGRNRRSRSQFPALNKGLNLTSRKDYIESDHIDGVFDKDGKMVIRAFTDEEKRYYNQWYEETIVTNFFHDPELKRLNRSKRQIIEDDVVRTLKEEVKALNEDKESNRRRIRELKEIIKITKKQNEEIYADKLEEIEQELEELRQEKLLYPNKEDHKMFYSENNARNSCIFNKMNSMNKLVFLEAEEYDTFIADRLQGLDHQYLTIYDIEREMYEVEEERLAGVLREEAELKKKSKS